MLFTFIIRTLHKTIYMKPIEQLKAYVNDFKHMLMSDEIKSVEVFSGIKPSSYYVPDILGYLGSLPPKPSWFIEVYINGRCIWRKDKSNDNNENLSQYEDELAESIIREMVVYGVNSQWLRVKNL